MQPGTSYSPSTSFALLIIGQPKSGKTNLAFEFPSPWFADCDGNLGSAIRRHPGKEFFFDSIATDDTNIPVPLDKQWARYADKLIAAAKDPRAKTLVTDSLTTLCPMLQAHIIATGTKLIVGGEKCMEQQHWTPFRNLMLKAINIARSSGKYVIHICHEAVDKDEISGMLSYKPLIPGQLKDSIGAFFTDVWHCENELAMNTVSKQMEPKYIIRTMPTARMGFIGNSLNLPQTFQFTWEEFHKHLTGVK